MHPKGDAVKVTLSFCSAQPIHFRYMFYIFHFQFSRLFIKKKKLNPYVRVDTRVLRKFLLPSLPICDSLEIYEMCRKSQAMAGNKNNVNG